MLQSVNFGHGAVFQLRTSDRCTQSMIHAKASVEAMPIIFAAANRRGGQLSFQCGLIVWMDLAYRGEHRAFEMCEGIINSQHSLNNNLHVRTTAENSPAFQRRVESGARVSPVGTVENTMMRLAPNSRITLANFQASLRDAVPSRLAYPALKRRAIFRRPSDAGTCGEITPELYMPYWIKRWPAQNPRAFRTRSHTGRDFLRLGLGRGRCRFRNRCSSMCRRFAPWDRFAGFVQVGRWL
jgi:hypothetical protein